MVTPDSTDYTVLQSTAKHNKQTDHAVVDHTLQTFTCKKRTLKYPGYKFILTSKSDRHTQHRDLPCRQNPLSYHGQTFIFFSGSICKNGHSLLPHSPTHLSHVTCYDTAYTVC